MAINFVEWAIEYRDKSNQQNGKFGSTQIDIGGQIGKLKVFQSDANRLKQVVTVDGFSMYPLDAKTVMNVETWAKGQKKRLDVCEKLVAYLCSNSKKQTNNGGIVVQEKWQGSGCRKTAIRVAALKALQAKHNSFEVFLPSPKFSLIVNNSYPSLFSLCNQLMPFLLAGTPLTIQSNAVTAIHGAYLLDLLLEFGMLPGVVNQLVNFNLTNAAQICSFVLLEDADVDSALDSALDSLYVHGTASVKIFVQESLKASIQKVLKHKLSVEFVNNDMFFSENDLFNLVFPNATINLDAVNFEADQSGIDVYFYRSPSEVIKMVNHLQGPLEQRFVSIWSQSASFAYKVAKSVNSCKRIAINGGAAYIDDCIASSGWYFELIGCTTLSQLVSDNSCLSPVRQAASKRWRESSLSTRAYTIYSLLDNVKLSNPVAIKFALPKTMQEVNENTSANKLIINSYQPVGTIIVQLDDSDATSAPDIYAALFNFLLFGNKLIMVAKANCAQLMIWKEIENFFADHNLADTVRTITSDSASGLKVAEDQISNGVLLFTDRGSINGLLIFQKQILEDYSLLFQRLLRYIGKSIVIDLPDFEMSSIAQF